MAEAFKTMLKQPYWVIALIFGTFLITFPFLTVGKEPLLQPHPASSLIPVFFGATLLLVSFAGFVYGLIVKHAADKESLDLSRVTESQGQFSTTASDCEIRVVEGRIEEYVHGPDVTVVLPCNEYFDDRCAQDAKSALGAFVNRKFGTQVGAFIELAKQAAKQKFGAGALVKKTENETAESFGTGKCVLLSSPFGMPDSIALISTTTQRAGEGLAAQISCLFQGLHELVKCLADARINEVVMPVLGGGHGGIRPPLAFIGLLLAVAEAAKYGRGAQRLKRVTIIVFKKDLQTSSEVDRTTIRRALALISSQS